MNIFNFEFKRLLKGNIIWALVCSVLIVMFMLFFPSMKEMGMQELVGSKLESLPEAFLEAFNIAVTVDVSPAFNASIFVGSKVTSQSAGLLADNWISFNNDEPVFFTSSSIRFTSPAVISVLSNPLGVVSSI